MKISEIKKIDEAFVFCDDKIAGKIVRTNDGSIFEYDKNYLDSEFASSISYSMPTSKTSYTSIGNNLSPFFANLLPEGLRLQVLTKISKTSLDDMLTLLIAAGPNCVGDVFLNISNKFENIEPSANEDYNKTSFWRLFEDSVNSKNYEDKLNDISLAGVYPKISAATISFPVNFINKKSQYILKLEPKEFPCLVANEFFFMSLAEKCDIEVPKVKIILDKNNEPGLLVERFDRKYIKSEKRIKRIHQEDACQLLNIYPSEKYRRSFRDIADQIEKTSSSPIIEITKLIRIYLYSYFIANGDLHAKNISVLEDRKIGRVFLSPAYDLLSTLPYGDTEMALEIEGKKNNIRYKDIINFAKRYKIVPKALDQIIDVLKNQILLSTDKLTEIGLSDKKTAFLIKTIKQRTEKF